KYELYIKSLLFMLLISIFRYTKYNTDVKDKITNIVDQKMLDIASYINKNLCKNLSLNRIANEFYISPSYLSRTFKRVTGFNISKYIQLVRIKEAQKLLRETNLKIIDIASLVGFTQIAHF